MGFNPGFRFSVLDGVIIATALLGTWYLLPYSWLLSVIVLFVVAHFFLFCNIVRMSRIPELIWASIFVLLTIASISLNLISWHIAASLSLLSTAVLVLREIRQPFYHGVLWKRLNPDLPDWFEANSKSCKA